MARRVRPQVMTEAAAADNKLDALPSATSCKPVSEVATPTTPEMREKMMKNPVARFPIG